MVKTRTLLCAVAVLAVLVLASACSSGGGGGSSTASYCAKIKKYNSEGVTSDIQGKKALAALEDVEKSAPAEIKDDLNALVNASKKLSGIDPNDYSALESAAKNLDTKKLDSASDHLDSYTEKHCHIDLAS